MKRTKRFRKWMTAHWKTISVWVFVMGGSLTLYTIALGTHSSGILPEEQAYITANRTLADAVESPAFLPHRVATYALSKAGAEHIAWFRMVSVIIAVLAVACFYYVLHRWYTRRVALIGTVLFATSTIMLHFSRIALPDALLLSVTYLLAVGLWLQTTRHRQRALIVFVTMLASTIYVPGLIWVTFAVLAWQGKRLVRVMRRQSLLFRALVILAVVMVLAPAAYSLSQNPREILSVAGLPTGLSDMSIHIDHVRSTISGLLWRNTASPSLWVNGTPILDVISIAMLVLGVYSLRFERRLLRFKIQLGLLALGLVLALTLGPVAILAAIPIVYLLITGGFAFMLQQWFTVFPRNPFARMVAVVCITVTVLGVAGYHTYRYAVAWPNHPDTRQVKTNQYLVK
jgi:4-amino-4-deoxy-L-arabinose transferase-like glycosyltransferase